MITVTLEGPEPTRLRYEAVQNEADVWVVAFASEKELHTWMQSTDRGVYRLHEVSKEPNRPTLADMRAAEDEPTSRQKAIKAARDTLLTTPEGRGT